MPITMEVSHFETGPGHVIDPGEKTHLSYRGHNQCWSTNIAWSSDGTQIATAAQKEVYVWADNEIAAK